MASDAKKILLVEDEKAIRDAVAAYLEREGYWVVGVGDGQSAIEEFEKHQFDLVVLDLMLPKIPGERVCRTIRDTSDVPIIMLTAKGEIEDRIIGLELGADDYLIKPFSPRELVARVRAMLRRPRTGPAAVPEQLTIGPLLLDVAAREVRLDGVPVDLTRTEFDVLAALASRPRGVWNRRQLIEEVWGRGWVGDEHLVDVHVGHLRRKLGDDPASPRFVRTVRGVGYSIGSGT